MDAEKIAVNNINQLLLDCCYLSSYIQDNDRTPFTDGHIDIHNVDSDIAQHSNSSFTGRVGVQVKGRAESSANKQRMTFSVSREELSAFLSERGIIYFVVFIDKKTKKKKPHYAILNPFKIQDLLSSMKPRQKTIAIPLRPLPKDPKKLERIVRLSYQAQNENPNMRMDPSLLKDIRSVTIFTDGSIDLDVPVRLTRSEFDYSIVYETSHGIRAAGDDELLITPLDYLPTVTGLVVSCGEFVFTNPTRRRLSPDAVDFALSEGLSIQVNDETEAQVSDRIDPRAGVLNLSLGGDLGQRYRDLGFFLACADNQSFSSNGKEMKVQITNIEDEQELRDHFKYLRMLNSLFTHLSVDTSLIDPESIDSKRARQLTALHDVLIEGVPLVESLRKDGRILQPVGSWGIQLLVFESDIPGKWVCKSLFDPDLERQFIMTTQDPTDDSDQGQVWRATPYEAIEVKYLPYTLNLHLGNLVDAYNAISEYPVSFDLAGTTVLKLIQAADLVEERASEFLNAAGVLNRWLIEHQGERPVHVINQQQIAARTVGLNPSDRKIIRDIKGQASRREIARPVQSEAACAILLGDAEDIDYCLSRLKPDELDELQSWPVWNLEEKRRSIQLFSD